MYESTELVDRASALRPVLERDQAEGERGRRLTDEVVAGLTDSGLLRLFVPSSVGGTEVGLRTAVDVTTELAHGDPSASWVVMILGAGDWLAGLYPAEVQQEIYASGPDTNVCTVLTPRSRAERVDGGWRLTGEWFPSSGCLHSEWGLFGFPMGDESGLAAIPLSDLRIKESWFTVGMRATGSNSLVGEDVFVPARRVLRMSDAITGLIPRDVPRYRSAMLPTLLTFMLGPYLGIASAALEHVLGLADRRGVSFTTFQRQRDSTAFQLAVAEAAAKIDVARLLARSCADLVDGHADAGTFPDYLTRARVRLHTSHAVQQCAQALDILVSAHGASGLADSSPLSVYLRDMQTATRHAMISPAMNLEVFGRALLNVEPNITHLI